MKKINLLIIEDEVAIRDMLRFSLPTPEFSVQDAGSVDEAKSCLSHTIPDLILLDWMLPGKSGIDFIQWLKQQSTFSEIPIIMLTAKAEEENKIKGLSAGADDYITKPFSPNELIARIKAVLRRRVVVSPNNVIVYNTLHCDVEKHQVTIDGERLSLTPMEYKLLHFFMSHPNKAYARDYLLTHVWGATVYVDDRTVDATIRRLRDKLSQAGYGEMIKTVRGVGYQFEKDH